MSIIPYFNIPGSRPVDPAVALLGNEPEGLAIDFTRDRAYNRDRVTAANNYLGGAASKFPVSRGSDGTYFDAASVLQTAGPNVLRLTHDPVTGQALGALLEGAATNRLTNSKFDGAVSGSPGTPPTGWSRTTSTGTLEVVDFGDYKHLKLSASASRQGVGQSIPVSAGKTYFFSVPVDILTPISVNQLTDVRTMPSGATFSYYLDGAPVANPNTPISVGQHIIACLVTTTTTAGMVAIQLAVGASSPATGEVIFGTPQFEEGTFRTSAILTPTSASAQRLADSLSFARAGTPEGTITINARSSPEIGTVYGQSLIWWTDGTSDNRIVIFRSVDRHIYYQVKVGGAQPVSIDLGLVADSTEFRLDATWKEGRYGAALNSSAAIVSGYSGPAPALNDLKVGRSISANQEWFGTLASLRLVPRYTPLPGMPS